MVVYHTPGHSPGHISLFDKQSGYLFTGDLFYDETPIYAFYPTTSPTDLVDSLEKIAAIEDVTKIYGSHNTIGIDLVFLLKSIVQSLICGKTTSLRSDQAFMSL